MKINTSKFGALFNMLGLIGAWVLIFAYFSWRSPLFKDPSNLILLARQGTITALAALGMTYIIIAAGIDLSVGSVVALVTIVIAWVLSFYQTNPILAHVAAVIGPTWLALICGLLVGMTAGLINGLLITRLRVGPFIVTLGTLDLWRGVAKWIGNEQKIDAPLSWLNKLLARQPGDGFPYLPYGTWILLAFSIVAAAGLRFTRFGRHVVAVGSNEAAARLCGVPIRRVTLWIYVIGGLFAGLAGLMQFSRLTVGDPTVAIGLELDVIAAVVIGGASLSGGEGSIAGTLLGALIMTTIRAGCAQIGYSSYVQEIVTGLVIVLAVTLDRLRVKKTT